MSQYVTEREERRCVSSFLLLHDLCSFAFRNQSLNIIVLFRLFFFRLLGQITHKDHNRKKRLTGAAATRQIDEESCLFFPCSFSQAVSTCLCCICLYLYTSACTAKHYPRLEETMAFQTPPIPHTYTHIAMYLYTCMGTNQPYIHIYLYRYANT